MYPNQTWAPSWSVFDTDIPVATVFDAQVNYPSSEEGWRMLDRFNPRNDIVNDTVVTSLAVRWTGDLFVNDTGVYSFALVVDGIGRLVLDGVEVMVEGQKLA